MVLAVVEMEMPFVCVTLDTPVMLATFAYVVKTIAPVMVFVFMASVIVILDSLARIVLSKLIAPTCALTMAFVCLVVAFVILASLGWIAPVHCNARKVARARVCVTVANATASQAFMDRIVRFPFHARIIAAIVVTV
jgi:hypothetical protein